MSASMRIQSDLVFGFREFEFHGGPYRYKPGNAFGVCLLEEAPAINAQNYPKVHLPIRDFSVPEDKAEVEDAIKRTFSAALDGETVYVGCMGGKGRTGLFLALLTKVARGTTVDAVTRVRTVYNRHAVETEEQEDYVRGFDVTGLRQWLYWEIVKRWFTKVFFWA